MSERNAAGDPVPKRFRRLRFNPMRDVLPWVAAVVGIFMAIRGAFDLSASGDSQGLIVGLSLTAIAIAAFCINRWQSKRGL
ncbi:hypothetical protein GCM10027413_29360 [Conyzicola nivalis]|uniref:Uncharacterized protein n=1 Tax=Conyzicola nivalis TaxID=1477021 RepID=A0A916SRZ3_9MICO|nr:hypothetical protein [Conyzicola nivalis]GGB13654.1 hypothetical protein GCM10010979_30150 [Conyzicola nivalis]